jgi:hypothetical protein
MMERDVHRFVRFVILAIIFGALTPWAAQAKDFGKALNGRTISCDEAAQYRDKILIREYDAIAARYDDGTADRQKRVLDKLNAELKQLDDKWAKAAPELKRKVAAQWAVLTLSLVGVATGEWAAVRTSVSDKVAVKLPTDRATNASTTMTTAVVAGKVNLVDVALLPVSAIVMVAFPPAALGVTALSIGLAAIDQYENLADLSLEKSAYAGTAEVLKNALRQLAAKSVANQLQRLNQVKNEIDKACG